MNRWTKSWTRTIPQPVAAADLTADQTRVLWRIAGLLLDYPRAETLASLERLAATVRDLPAPAGPALLGVCEHLAATPETTLARDYVETFDLRRRHCLHLSYFAYGDTRKRGMALLRFKQAYRQAGADLGDHELPDHLAVVLEFAAIVDPVLGRRLILEYRPVLELLRQGLREAGSPYVGVFDALDATLPALSESELRRLRELAAQGPPSEDVGLEPFAADPTMFEHEGARR